MDCTTSKLVLSFLQGIFEIVKGIPTSIGADALFKRLFEAILPQAMAYSNGHPINSKRLSLRLAGSLEKIEAPEKGPDINALKEYLPVTINTGKSKGKKKPDVEVLNLMLLMEVDDYDELLVLREEAYEPPKVIHHSSLFSRRTVRICRYVCQVKLLNDCHQDGSNDLEFKPTLKETRMTHTPPEQIHRNVVSTDPTPDTSDLHTS